MVKIRQILMSTKTHGESEATRPWKRNSVNSRKIQRHRDGDNEETTAHFPKGSRTIMSQKRTKPDFPGEEIVRNIRCLELLLWRHTLAALWKQACVQQCRGPQRKRGPSQVLPTKNIQQIRKRCKLLEGPFHNMSRCEGHSGRYDLCALFNSSRVTQNSKRWWFAKRMVTRHHNLCSERGQDPEISLEDASQRHASGHRHVSQEQVHEQASESEKGSSL